MPRSNVPTAPLFYAACSVSVAPVRREPSHRAEQTSQLLFGERAEVLQLHAETDWALVRGAWDGYEGWCKMGQLRSIAPKDFRREAHYISSSHVGVLRLEGSELWLPAGSELTGMKKGMVPICEISGKFRGKKVDMRKKHNFASSLLSIAQTYLHAPYQWGGRSLAGIDCSGLVQMAFKGCGVAVLRDASEQATLGSEVHFLAEAQAGDLAFFDNPEGRIVHVGILADKQTIIHATDTAGRVVEDRIDNAGIISIMLKKRTHQLRTIRRIAL